MTESRQTPRVAPRQADGPDPELARIVERAAPGARILRAKVMGPDDDGRAQQATAKAAGYGVPIRIDVTLEGAERSFVLHGTSANPFGHDRRADRAAELLLAADTFGSVPRHVRALEVGAFRQDGSSVSLRDTGEFYLLTEYAPGHAYAEELRRIAEQRALTQRDRERVLTLTRYLAELHAQGHDDKVAWQRCLRDLLGSGEGIFGISDAYPDAAPGVEAGTLEQIEGACLSRRWQLKRRAPRLTRVHGDFHPFNVLFDEDTLHVLDTSRGSLGDPADDVACMAVNYVFFALEREAAWHGVFAPLWYEFWDRYLQLTQDQELLQVVAPFLAWRLLVLACPVWYPNLGSGARRRLLDLARSALDAERFDPRSAEEVFA